jgi:hypothetical protein
MTVHLHKHKISYISVPKCGSTTLKHALFHFENGCDFRPFVTNGNNRHIHNTAYPFKPFNQLPHNRIKDYDRIAIVRDPIARMTSCYANRVIKEGDLDEIEIPPDLYARGVRRRPEFPRFVDLLRDYRAISPLIAHHTEPLAFFLGRSSTWFTRLFPLEQLHACADWITSRTGQPLNLEWHLRSSASAQPDRPDLRTRERIDELFEDDHRLFGAHF